MPHICILSTSNEFRTDQQEAAVQLAVLSLYPRKSETDSAVPFTAMEEPQDTNKASKDRELGYMWMDFYSILYRMGDDVGDYLQNHLGLAN
eukprot:jgi/Botrbrau1/7985/Bobra.384_2s0013.1